MIDVETLRAVLRYDPETGKLFWLSRPLEMFKSRRSCDSWNTKFAGKEAMTAVSSAGYRCGRVLDRGYLAHRVIWAIVSGAWPTEQIDHINGERTDNRTENLREATHSENCRNIRKLASATSSYFGVSWCSRFKVWRSHIRTGNGKQTALGTFRDEREAAMAYDAAAKQHHGEFARLNFP